MQRLFYLSRAFRIIRKPVDLRRQPPLLQEQKTDIEHDQRNGGEQTARRSDQPRKLAEQLDVLHRLAQLLGEVRPDPAEDLFGERVKSLHIIGPREGNVIGLRGEDVEDRHQQYDEQRDRGERRERLRHAQAPQPVRPSAEQHREQQSDDDRDQERRAVNQPGDQDGEDYHHKRKAREAHLVCLLLRHASPRLVLSPPYP